MNRSGVERFPVILIGMHRSGTSMLAQMLEELGVFLGRDHGTNHEARFFKRINKWIYTQVNATWDSPDNMSFFRGAVRVEVKRVVEERVRGRQIADFVGRLGAWRYRELGRLDYPWGWKDPRNAYTVDLWKEIFPAARVLHIYRHPLDVARSLQRREQRRVEFFRDSAEIRKAEKALKRRPLYFHSPRLLDLRHGVSLWEQYVGSALQKSQAFGDDVMHCKFEAFLEDPAAHLAEIATFLSLDVPRETVDRVAAAAKLDRSLAYASDPELAALADEIKDLPLVRELGYA